MQPHTMLVMYVMYVVLYRDQSEQEVLTILKAVHLYICVSFNSFQKASNCDVSRINRMT